MVELVSSVAGPDTGVRNDGQPRREGRMLDALHTLALRFDPGLDYRTCELPDGYEEALDDPDPERLATLARAVLLSELLHLDWRDGGTPATPTVVLVTPDGQETLGKAGVPARPFIYEQLVSSHVVYEDRDGFRVVPPDVESGGEVVPMGCTGSVREKQPGDWEASYRVPLTEALFVSHHRSKAEAVAAIAAPELLDEVKRIPDSVLVESLRADVDRKMTIQQIRSGLLRALNAAITA